MTWTVDESNVSAVASDENTGIDDAHPLLTWQEFSRRTWGTQVPAGTQMVTRMLSNMITGGGPVFIRGIGQRGGAPVSVSPLNSALNVVGVPTVVYAGAGTLAAPSQALKGTVGDIHFTDGAAPAFSNATGRLWGTTAPQVSYMWPLKDLTGGVWRVGVPARNANNNARTLTAGDSWSIFQLPTAVGLVNLASLAAGLQTQIALLDIRDQGFIDLDVGAITYSACDFSGSQAAYCGPIQYRNCRNWRYGDVQSGLQTIIIQGGVINTAATGGTIPAEGRTFWASSSTVYTCFQAIQLITDHGSEVSEFQGSFYDLATPCVSCPQPESRIDVVAIGGLNNTGKIISLSGLGSNAAVATFAAGMTSDASPFQLNAVTSTLPALIDVAVAFNAIESTAGSPLKGAPAANNGLFKFSGTHLGSAAGVHDSFLADEGNVATVVELTAAPGYPMSPRTAQNLRVNPRANTLATAATATVMKNGVATAVTVNIPAGSTAIVADVADTVAFVANDTLDLRIESTAAGAGHSLSVSAVLELA
jgi:hypothetical protein